MYLLKKCKNNEIQRGNRGNLGSIFATYVPRTTTPLQSILWPIIDPILVSFGQKEFSRSQLYTKVTLHKRW